MIDAGMNIEQVRVFTELPAEKIQKLIENRNNLQ